MEWLLWLVAGGAIYELVKAGLLEVLPWSKNEPLIGAARADEPAPRDCWPIAFAALTAADGFVEHGSGGAAEVAHAEATAESAGACAAEDGADIFG